MAVPFVVRICDLLPKFLADALILLCPLQAAGAIASGAFQSIPDHLYHLFVFIEPNCHIDISPASASVVKKKTA